MKTSMLRLSQMLALAVSAGVLGACAHSQADRGAGQGNQVAASTYDVPQENPKGKVYVMSLGGERLATGQGASTLYLHLRLAAENQKDTGPWVLDARNQLAVLGPPSGGNEGQTNGVAPAFAQGSGGSGLVQIQPGSRGSLDLYYPLPQGVEPQQVTFSWQVQRPEGPLAQQTVFHRQPAADAAGQQQYAYAPAYTSRVHLQVGPGWWWGPYWGMGWGWDPWYYGGWGYPYWGWGGYWGPGYYGWGGGGYGGRGYYRGSPSQSGWRGGGGADSGGYHRAAPSGVGSGFRGGGGSGWRGGGSMGGGSVGGGRVGGGSGWRSSPR